MTKEHIGKYAVAVPVFHLIVSSTFLWGWTTGFGSNSVVLADAKDIFSISISNMVSIYIGGLFMPMIYISTRKELSVGVREIDYSQWTKEDFLEKIAEAKISLKKLKRRNVIIATAIYSIGIFGAAWTFYRYIIGVNIGMAIGLVPLLIFAIMMTLTKVKDIKNLDTFILAVSAVGLMTNAMASGVVSGQAARYSKYEESKFAGLHCEDSVVLRRLGDNFVAVTKADTKIVTNLECEQILSVPSGRPERTLALNLQPTPHITYELKRQVTH